MTEISRRLDDVDHALARELRRDGRQSNRQLAQTLGLSESACSARVRALLASGVITGVHAELDHARLGFPVQALVAIRFATQGRAQFDALRDSITAIPGVVRGFHLSGATDYLVHIAARSPDDLRDIVLDHLTSRDDVAQVETSLIFETVNAYDETGARA